MLQMDCPNCDGVIKSQFLADLSTIECDQCKSTIPVKDVFVSTKSFVMHREDFLNRTFRFQKLLREVEKELLLMTNNKEVSQKALRASNNFTHLSRIYWPAPGTATGWKSLVIYMLRSWMAKEPAKENY